MSNTAKRAWRVIDDRLGISKALKPLMSHKVPKQSKWAYVFGTATLFSFVLQVVTGVVLATTYVPSTENAYSTLKYIDNQALLGHVVRGLHYFGASAMIMFIGIHMLQAYMYASYKYPREANWLTGVVLLMLTLTMGFTGQLLRWDQIAYWSVNIAARQAARVPWIGLRLEHFVFAGDHIGGATLTHFYDLHVFIIPALIIMVVGVHLYLVIYHGISAPPKAGQPVDPSTERKKYEQIIKKDGVPFWPDAAWRDALFGSLVVAAVVALAFTIGPPQLSKPPDPTLLNAYPRPDWYLLWYFAVLAMSPHKLENYIIILGPALIFGSMFLLPFFFNKGERAISKRPWAIGWIVIIVLGVCTLWYEGRVAPWSPRFEAQPLPESVYAASGPAAHRGAVLFHDKGCEYCHQIQGHGGLRGPNLSDVANRMTEEQMTIRILGGGHNMPAFAGILHPDQMNDILAFLKTLRMRPGPSLNTPHQ
ncbi:MAG: cytochrome b N-terminal domain-containing protein [Acidobacteriaceae bacterium]